MAVCGAADPRLLASDVTRRYGMWRAPDVDKALLHHRAEHSHHDFFDVWSSRVRDLKEFGVGHMMYFYFLYWMAGLFAVLTLLSAAPNMILNYLGKYYTTGAIELVSLGNYGRTSIAHNNDGSTAFNTIDDALQQENASALAFMADAYQPAATTPFNKAAGIVAMSLLDFCGVMVYFAVTLGLILVSRRLAHEADLRTVTIHDYSIWVERLPSDAQAEELVEFFSQYGEVVHVEMVRAYGRLVRLVLQRGRLLRQLELSTAALQREAQSWEEVPARLEAACYRIKDKLNALSREIEAEQVMADNKRVVGAFITFKDEGAKQACLRAQPHSRMRHWLTVKPEHKLRGRYAMLVMEAPEPSDVQYENMEHSGLDRFMRACLVSVCSYFCLAVGFVLISLASTTANTVKNQLGSDSTPSTQQCSTACDLYCNGTWGLTTMDRDVYAQCASSDVMANGTLCAAEQQYCQRCYCNEAIAKGMVREFRYCKDTIKLLLLQTSSQGMIVVVILLINSLLVFTSRRLTSFEKHHTRSAEARSLAQKLFLGQFLNSALSTIIANAHVPFLQQLLNGTAADKIFFQGIYTDLTPGWYKVVGRSLVVSQFVAALLRAFNLLVRWLTIKYKVRQQHKCLTRHELQESMRGPSFELDHRYGEHLNQVYVSMLLSGGQPICYLAAAVWFLSSYWCDKVELLRMSHRPTSYGSDLSNMVHNLLPFAAVWHVGFALWAFSLLGVRRSKLITDGFAALVLRVCTAMAAVWKDATSLSPQQVTERLLAADSAHLLILLIVMVGSLFLKVTFTMWIKAARGLLSLVGAINDNDEAELSGAPEFPVAVRTQLLVGETSYAIQAQPNYAAAFTKMEDTAGEILVQVVMKQGAQKLADKRTEGRKASQQQQAQPQQQQQQQQRPGPRSASELDKAGPGGPDDRRNSRTSVPALAQAVQQQQQRRGAESQQAGSSSANRRAKALAQAAQAELAAQAMQQESAQQDGNMGDSPAGSFWATPRQQGASAPSNGSSTSSSRPVQQQQHHEQQSAGILAAAESEAAAGSARPSLPQKYRQARANMVVPVASEYVAAARAADRGSVTQQDINE